MTSLKIHRYLVWKNNSCQNRSFWIIHPSPTSDSSSIFGSSGLNNIFRISRFWRLTQAYALNPPTEPQTRPRRFSSSLPEKNSYQNHHYIWRWCPGRPDPAHCWLFKCDRICKSISVRIWLDLLFWWIFFVISMLQLILEIIIKSISYFRTTF